MNYAISRQIRCLLAVFVLAVGLGLPLHAAHAIGAATFTVNSTSDADNASDGICTLREAIWAANNDIDYHECVHSGTGFGDDLIVFALTGDPTITLASNFPTISTGLLTINGNNAGDAIVVDGATLYTPFYVSSGGTLTLRSLTVQHGFGSVGGGASNVGTLTILDSTFIGNNASSEGGAVANFGGTSLTIANSTFEGNSAPYGAAISNNNGTATILNSTISQNTGTAHGGALSTWASAATTVRNSILANSSGVEDCWNGGGGTLSGDHNIIETTAAPDCSTITSSTADPQLGLLTGNPLYATFGSTSPARDAGSDSVCTAAPVNAISQNGIRRPQGPHCDLGSYEASLTVIFRSTGSQDGWVLETSETSSMGGTLNSAATTLRLGDDAGRKQYRSILSFTTSSLPDTAVILNVKLKVRKQSTSGGGNPISLLQGFMLDVRKGPLGTTALQTTDFQAVPSRTVGPLLPTAVAGWYSLDLTDAKASINKLTTASGLTQIRLRFKLGDNNNAVANLLSLYSGDVPLASRPQLTIIYYVP